MRTEELLERFDGLLLAGGGDIEPARYGAADHPAQYGTDPDRDELELELARAAVRTEPAHPGDLPRRAAAQRGLRRHPGPAPARHRRAGRAPRRGQAGDARPPGRARQPPGRGLGQRQAQCRSHHHQGLDRLGGGFRPVAWAPDGLVEGIERDQGWTVGVLWHPESTAAADPVQHRLLRLRGRGVPAWTGVLAATPGAGRVWRARERRRVNRVGRSVRTSR